MQQGKSFLKVNDQVEVLTGKDKGRVGKIIKVYRKSDKALVERINMIKRHTKARAAGQEGQIVEKEAPIHVSNLMLVCPKCTNTVRVAKKTLDDGSKVRICKKCSENVEPSKKK
ncbi:MAG: 50S ribosomal protein L24 [Desulfobulbaceae bacterium]|jgi:large subunit ribosomal protein L24|nr:50S ribosomal protein L24 [Desulfobulbaceae bacterium]HKJ14855.1 50S ribosomal protein L24 [Desulfobulbales bacterium]MDH3541088.1 50S ribosomal protein L24 [Desulfobulbaceae bacterium]MDH3781237.1 50S ribosomal protein L24 [Desulfobulbaceae bacterium]MDH3866874.1 50S ribosomal protein L24 [Desulfobulbaceae bacterium]